MRVTARPQRSISLIEPAAGEMDGVARHVEMEPSPPADARLEAVEIRHRYDDPAVAAERLDRASQPQDRVVEMLEHVPEDDDVGVLGGRAERLDRRVPDIPQRSVAPRRVRLDPDDGAPLFREPTEEPAVSRSDLDHARPRRERAERTEDRGVREAPQRLEQQVDGSGRRGVGAAAVQPRCIVWGATDRDRRAARTAAVETVERRRRAAVGTANRKPGLHRGDYRRRHRLAPVAISRLPRRRRTGANVRARMRRSRPTETFSM